MKDWSETGLSIMLKPTNEWKLVAYMIVIVGFVNHEYVRGSIFAVLMQVKTPASAKIITHQSLISVGSRQPAVSNYSILA